MPTALSTHFTLEELTISQEAVRAGIDNTPPAAARANLVRLAQTLEQIRTLLGDKSIHISSGFRCEALNTRIGGSPTSVHCKGLAADFIAPAFGTPFEIATRIAASDLAFDQLIHEFGRWVHVGIPPEGAVAKRKLNSIFKSGTYLAGIVPDQSHIA